MTYEDFKYLLITIASDEILSGKGFSIAKNLIYNGYQRGLVPMVYKFFDKKSSCGVITCARSETLRSETLDMQDKCAIENKNMSNQQLVEQLHKTFIKKFEKRKVHSSFIENVWGADLTDT